MSTRKPELGKYLLWSHFSKSKAVRPYLPATRRINREAFLTYLKKYKMVYVKPSGGSRGMGIMKVWTGTSGQVFVKKTVLASHSFTGPEAAWKYVAREIKRRPYIVQRGLYLAKVGGRAFDVRVMVQRPTPSSDWKYSGMVAKVAGKSSVVTNVALGKGYVLEVEDALRRAYGWKNGVIQQRVAELKNVALKAARHFDNYQRYRELGFDMAFDTKGKLWLIEENTAPSHPLFRRLRSNLKMWRLIEYRYGQYNRALRKKRA